MTATFLDISPRVALDLTQRNLDDEPESSDEEWTDDSKRAIGRASAGCTRWTSSDKRKLMNAVKKSGNRKKKWKFIAEEVFHGTRTVTALQQQYQVSRNGTVRIDKQ